MWTDPARQALFTAWLAGLQSAQALDLAHGQVNVKAKTAEKLGPVGQGSAIEARAVVLLLKA